MKSKKMILIAAALAVAINPTLACAQEAGQESPHYTFDDVVNTGLDNGYSGSAAISKDDPHWGWKMGEFHVTGYTAVNEDDCDCPVFLRNNGDEVKLSFKMLKEDIDNLYGSDVALNDTTLSLNDDENGWDESFGQAQCGFGKGMLIVEETNSGNEEQEPVAVAGYLEGTACGSDTEIKVCEEGDYRVTLDYELKRSVVALGQVTPVAQYFDYRITFEFKVRNAGCDVFPVALGSGSDLEDSARVDDGFGIDTSGSDYLDVTVERIDESGSHGVDAASVNDRFIERGMYNVTATNGYTGAEVTKTVYVGDYGIAQTSDEGDDSTTTVPAMPGIAAGAFAGACAIAAAAAALRRHRKAVKSGLAKTIGRNVIEVPATVEDCN